MASGANLPPKAYSDVSLKELIHPVQEKCEAREKMAAKHIAAVSFETERLAEAKD
jgi:hypothetical protein